jgi:undecaprenyl pyrophosphate phosphatase UppP
VWIWEIIVNLYAILAVVPVIPFLLVYFGYAAYTGDRKKAFRLAMDVTTALLIGCVAVLFDSIFESSFGLYGILLIMLIGGGLLGNVQYRARGSVDVKRVVRAIWRLGFFLMGLFYVVLMCIGIGKSFFTI